MTTQWTNNGNKTNNKYIITQKDYHHENITIIANWIQFILVYRLCNIIVSYILSYVLVLDSDITIYYL